MQESLNQQTGIIPDSFKIYLNEHHIEYLQQDTAIQLEENQEFMNGIHPDVIKYLSCNQGKIGFYVADDFQLSYILPIVNKLNCSVVLLCETIVNREHIESGANTLIIPIEQIAKIKSVENPTLEKEYPDYFYYYNTVKIILTLLKPACVFYVPSESFHGQVLIEVGGTMGMPVLNLKEQDYVNIENYIRLHIPYGFIADKTGLQIGCANHKLNNWLNTDICCNVNGVYYLDAGKPFPFPNESFEYIYSEHLFEHLTWEQELTMLAECHRVLKKKGIMRIAMPDMTFLIDLFLHPDEEKNRQYLKWGTESFLPQIAKFYEGKVYRPEYVINHFFRGWGHQLLHSPSEFKLMAERCGFHSIRQMEIGKSEIQALNGVEQHFCSIPEWANKLETFVFELDK